MATTGRELSYKGFIDTDFINVRFDNVLYENIPKVASNGFNTYGDYLNEHPFEIDSHTNGDNYVFLAEPDVTHTIEVLSVVGKSEVNVDECFKKAVKSCVDNVIVAETNRPQSVSLSLTEGRTPDDATVVFADIEDISEKYWVEMEVEDLGGTRSIRRFPIITYIPNGVMFYEGDNSSDFYLATPTEGWHINFFSPKGGIIECAILPTSANVLQGN